MILITGATGNLGTNILNFLLKKKATEPFAGLIRNEEKAKALRAKGIETRFGDYNNYNSLLKAFKGVDKLYFISSGDAANRDRQHVKVVKAAQEAGVKHILYTSFQRKREDAGSAIAFIAKCHIETEKHIFETEIPYTILKHALYMEVLPMFVGEKVVENGSIFLPAGEGKVSYASRNDMAEAAANILTSEGHENKVYEISGSKAYSFGELAGILSNLSGKKINYVAADTEQYRQELYKARIPADIINTIIGFSNGIKDGEFDFPSDKLNEILGHEALTPQEFLKKAYL
jgi:NAD(P)H dehydrogenase (quinone)